MDCNSCGREIYGSEAEIGTCDSCNYGRSIKVIDQSEDQNGKIWKGRVYFNDASVNLDDIPF